MVAAGGTVQMRALLRIVKVRFWPNPADYVSLAGCLALNALTVTTGRYRPKAVFWPFCIRSLSTELTASLCLDHVADNSLRGARCQASSRPLQWSRSKRIDHRIQDRCSVVSAMARVRSLLQCWQLLFPQFEHEKFLLAFQEGGCRALGKR